jgi:hypothetical protein
MAITCFPGSSAKAAEHRKRTRMMQDKALVSIKVLFKDKIFVDYFKTDYRLWQNNFQSERTEREGWRVNLSTILLS